MDGKSSPGVWADLAVAPQRHELYTPPFHLRTLTVIVIDQFLPTLFVVPGQDFQAPISFDTFFDR